MNKRGYTVGTYIIKSDRPTKVLPMCPICRKCRDRTLCENRKNKKTMSKCDKCRICKDVDKCDKFYINEQNKATLTIGRDISTGAVIRKTFTAKTQEAALDKMYRYKLQMKKRTIHRNKKNKKNYSRYCSRIRRY